MTGDVRIGTSGWSYPSGHGTWNGIFYPAGARPRSRGKGGFDELAFYANHFDTVEVNSSFYRTPSPDVTRGWAERTPPGFEFSVKLFQKFTHPSMFAKATGAGRASDVRPGNEDADAFRRALEPLASAGKLGAVLAQFPASFKADPASVEYLEWLLSTFRDYRVAVELRHRTWSDSLAGTLGLLDAFGAAWTQIDEPKFKTSVRQRFVPNIGAFFYMRLHGRNAAQWWSHESSEDRYNYLYSPEEIQPLARTAEAARSVVKKLYLYTNNHFEAKSVANAVMIKEQLGEPLTGEWPETFLARYPALRRILAAGAGPTASPPAP